MNRFNVPLNRFNAEVGGISCKYLGNLQKHKFYDNSTVLDALYLFQVPLSFIRLFLLGFPLTLAYKNHPAAIEVKVLSTVQEEYTFTSKKIRFEVIPVPDFFSVKSSRLHPTDHKGILLIHVSLGVLLIICNSNEK